MNSSANSLATKVYEIHSAPLLLHVAVHLDGRYVIDLKNGETLVDEGEITKKEFAVLWFMLTETHKNAGRTFTTQEIWDGGWPEYKGLPSSHKRVKGGPDNVSKTMSNLRGLLPTVMSKGVYGIKEMSSTRHRPNPSSSSGTVSSLLALSLPQLPCL